MSRLRASVQLGNLDLLGASGLDPRTVPLVDPPANAHDAIFKPLEMVDTQFKPPASLRARIAPTEIDTATGAPFRGVVHDPRARLMGGVAGHAGLFSVATDLSRFAEMMLGMGTRDGVRVFSPLTVRKFTSPETPPDQPVLRGLSLRIAAGECVIPRIAGRIGRECGKIIGIRLHSLGPIVISENRKIIIDCGAR